MKPTKEDSEKGTKVRAAIFDATEKIMQEEGYAAVSSRKVARKAGLKSQLLHYYFKTMDELFVAVWQRYDDRFLEHQARILASHRPLTALWQLSIDSKDVTLRHEFIALANHRKAIGALIARSARRNRNMQVAAITHHFEQHGIDQEEFSPLVLVLLFAFVSRSMITEENFGVTDDHAAIIGYIERTIAEIEGGSRKKTPRKTPTTRTALKPRRAARK